MWGVSAGLIFLSAVLAPLSHAGEVVLYYHAACGTIGPGYTIFSAGQSTDCVKAELSLGQPQIFGVSTSRNIGASCTFAFFTDNQCQRPAAQVVSSGPRKSCLPMRQGMRSYRVTCHDPRPRSLALPDRFPDFLDVGGYSYFQPRSTYRGKPSGHTNFFEILPIHGDLRGDRPSGAPSAAGVALARAFFKRVPRQAQDFRVTVPVGGTFYTVHVFGKASNQYTAEKAVAKLGQASFASMMADVFAALGKRPSTWLWFELVNGDHLDEEIGSVNVTYS